MRAGVECERCDPNKKGFELNVKRKKQQDKWIKKKKRREMVLVAGDYATLCSSRLARLVCVCECECLRLCNALTENGLSAENTTERGVRGAGIARHSSSMNRRWHAEYTAHTHTYMQAIACAVKNRARATKPFRLRCCCFCLHLSRPLVPFLSPPQWAGGTGAYAYSYILFSLLPEASRWCVHRANVCIR